MTMSHEEMRSLLAPYALGALDGDELEALELHIENCSECQKELDEHLDVVAQLTPDVMPPRGLWDSIAAQLDTPERAKVTPLVARARHQLRWAASAAAAVVLVGAGALVGRTTVDSTADLGDLAAEAADAPGAFRGEVFGSDGSRVATIVVDADGSGYFIAEELPRLGDDETYQLWTVRDNKAISVGILGPAPKVGVFAAVDAGPALALTVEPAGGVSAPTASPVATATVVKT